MIHFFKTFLPIAEKIYDRKADLDILHHIYVRDGYLMMTDLEIFVRMPIKYSSKAGQGNYTIPIKMLKKVLSTKPESLDIQTINNSKVKISFDDTFITIPFINTDEYPAFPDEKFTKVAQWNREVFHQLANQIIFASTDTLRPALTGVFVKQDAYLSSVATDGHILQWVKNLDTENKCLHFKDYETIIPARFLKIIARYAKEKTEVFQSKQYLMFKLDYGIEFFVRAIEEPYVDFERVIPIELPNTLTIRKKMLMKEIKSAKPFTEKAILKAVNGSIEFEANDIDENLSYQSTMKVENRDGKELDVYLNLNLLEKTVNSMDAEFIEWKYNDTDSPNILSDNENVLHLLMPIRRKEERDG